MAVTLKLPTLLASVIDMQVLEGNGNTVNAVLDDLCDKYPVLRGKLNDSQGMAYPHIGVYLNSEDIRYLGGGQAEVRDGDEISFVIAVAGG